MRRAGKARIYRTLLLLNSVAAAGIGDSANCRQPGIAARLHALGAKLDLHPPGQVFLRIHFHRPVVQEAAAIESGQRGAIRVRDTTPLISKRASSSPELLPWSKRHVDVGDRPLLYREIAVELSGSGSSFPEKALHENTPCLQRPSGKDAQRSSCIHLAHRELALHVQPLDHLSARCEHPRRNARASASSTRARPSSRAFCQNSLRIRSTRWVTKVSA